MSCQVDLTLASDLGSKQSIRKVVDNSTKERATALRIKLFCMFNLRMRAEKNGEVGVAVSYIRFVHLVVSSATEQLPADLSPHECIVHRAHCPRSSIQNMPGKQGPGVLGIYLNAYEPSSGTSGRSVSCRSMHDWLEYLLLVSYHNMFVRGGWMINR
jgi:hypothetical protein